MPCNGVWKLSKLTFITYNSIAIKKNQESPQVDFFANLFFEKKSVSCSSVKNKNK